MASTIDSKYAAEVERKRKQEEERKKKFEQFKANYKMANADVVSPKTAIEAKKNREQTVNSASHDSARQRASERKTAEEDALSGSRTAGLSRSRLTVMDLEDSLNELGGRISNADNSLAKAQTSYYKNRTTDNAHTYNRIKSDRDRLAAEYEQRRAELNAASDAYDDSVRSYNAQVSAAKKVQDNLVSGMSGLPSSDDPFYRVTMRNNVEQERKDTEERLQSDIDRLTREISDWENTDYAPRPGSGKSALDQIVQAYNAEAPAIQQKRNELEAAKRDLYNVRRQNTISGIEDRASSEIYDATVSPYTYGVNKYSLRNAKDIPLKDTVRLRTELFGSFTPVKQTELGTANEEDWNLLDDTQKQTLAWLSQKADKAYDDYQKLYQLASSSGQAPTAELDELSRAYQSARDELDTYSEYISDYLKQRNFAREQELIANSDKATQAVVGIVGGIARPLAYAETVANAIGNSISDEYKPIDMYSGGIGATRLASEARSRSIENLSPVGQFVAGVGYSIADNVMSMALGPVGASVYLGLGAAGEESVNALMEGKSAKEAAISGGIEGGIETLTEMIGMDNLFKTARSVGKAGVKNFIKSALKQAGAEASEEIIGAYASTIIDIIRSGDDSDYRKAIKELEESGASHENAVSQANYELFVKEPGLAALSGAISGFLFGTVASGKAVYNSYAVGQTIADAKAQTSILDIADQSDSQEARELATVIREKADSTGKVSNADIGYLASLLDQDMVAAAVDKSVDELNELAKTELPSDDTTDDTTSAQESLRLLAEPDNVSSDFADESSDETPVESSADEIIRKSLETKSPAQVRRELDNIKNRLYDSGSSEDDIEAGLERLDNLYDALDTAERKENTYPEMDEDSAIIKSQPSESSIIEAGKKLNREVAFYDEGENDEGYIKNGWYDNATRTVHINRRSQMQYETVFAHEYVHSLENTKYQARLVNTIAEIIGQDEFAARMREAQTGNASVGNPINATQAGFDVAADYIAENLVTNESAIQELANKNITLADQIKNFFDGIVVKFGDDDAKAKALARRASFLYAKAIKAAEKSGAGEGVRNSVSKSKQRSAFEARHPEDGAVRSLNESEQKQVSAIEADIASALKSGTGSTLANAKDAAADIVETIVGSGKISDSEIDSIADNLVNSRRTESSTWEYSKQIVDYLSRTSMYVSPELKSQLAAEYDGYANFHKQAFGSLRLTTTNQNAPSPEQVWQEAQSQFPGQFSEDVANPVDIINTMLDTVRTLRETRYEDATDTIDVDKFHEAVREAVRSASEGLDGFSKSVSNDNRYESALEKMFFKSTGQNASGKSLSQKVSESEEAYGRMKPGTQYVSEEDPDYRTRQNRPAIQMSDTEGTRRSTRTVANAPGTKNMEAEAMASVINQYQRTTNDEQVNDARVIREESKNLETAVERFKVLAENRGKMKYGTVVAYGAMLLNETAQANNSDLFLDTLFAYQNLSTELAQGLQAQKIINKLSPEGRVILMNKAVDKAVERRQSKGDKKEFAKQKAQYTAAGEYASEIEDLVKQIADVDSQIEQGKMTEAEAKKTLDALKRSLASKQKQLKKLADEIAKGFPDLKEKEAEALRYINKTNKELIDAYELINQEKEKYAKVFSDLESTRKKRNEARQELRRLFKEQDEVSEKIKIASFQTLEALAGIDTAKANLKDLNSIMDAADFSRRTARDLKRYIAGKGRKVTVPKELQIALANANTVEEARAIEDQIALTVAEQLPGTFAERMRSWRYLAMLGNVRTHERNILGNVSMYAIKSTKDVLGAGLEAIGGNGFKKRGEDRTKSVLFGFSAKDKAYLNEANAQMLLISDALFDERTDIAAKIEENRRIFSTDVINKISDINSDLLSNEDKLFLRLAFRKSYAQYLKANKADVSNLDEDLVDRATVYAIDEAKKATFHEKSVLANKLQSLENGAGNVANIVMGGILPFKATPINVVKQGLSYSPYSLGKAIYDIRKLNRGDISIGQYIDTISRGLTGTGLMVLGYFMANGAWSIRLIGKADDDEPDRKNNLDKLAGAQDYALQIGDKTYTLDWLGSAAMPIFSGVALREAINGEFSGEDAWAILDALVSTINPLTDMSMLQGITNVLNSYSESSGERLADLGISIGESYISQFIPTLVAQTARVVDPVQRQYYSSQTNPFAREVDRWTQQTLAKLPGLSKFLEPAIDVHGNVKKRFGGNILTRAAYNYLFPSYISEDKTNEIDAEMLRVYGATGVTDALPKSSDTRDITHNGEKYRLSKDEHVQYSATYGLYAYEQLDALMGSDSYKAMTDTEKAKAIASIFNDASEIAKDEWLDGRGFFKDVASDAINVWVYGENDQKDPSDYVIGLLDAPDFDSSRIYRESKQVFDDVQYTYPKTKALRDADISDEDKRFLYLANVTESQSAETMVQELSALGWSMNDILDAAICKYSSITGDELKGYEKAQALAQSDLSYRQKYDAFQYIVSTSASYNDVLEQVRDTLPANEFLEVVQRFQELDAQEGETNRNKQALFRQFVNQYAQSHAWSAETANLFKSGEDGKSGFQFRSSSVIGDTVYDKALAQGASDEEAMQMQLASSKIQLDDSEGAESDQKQKFRQFCENPEVSDAERVAYGKIVFGKDGEFTHIADAKVSDGVKVSAYTGIMNLSPAPGRKEVSSEQRSDYLFKNLSANDAVAILQTYATEKRTSVVNHLIDAKIPASSVKKAYDAISKLEPPEGGEEVTKNQIVSCVLDTLPSSDAEKVWRQYNDKQCSEFKEKSSKTAFGSDVAGFANLYFELNAYTSDHDSNGKSIKGREKKDKVMAAINKQKWTVAQKDAMYLAMGYAKSGVKNTPWH